MTNIKPKPTSLDFTKLPHPECYICKNIKQKKSGRFVCIYNEEEFDNFLRPEKCEGFEKKGKYNPSLRNSFEHEEL